MTWGFLRRCDPYGPLGRITDARDEQLSSEADFGLLSQSYERATSTERRRGEGQRRLAATSPGATSAPGIVGHRLASSVGHTKATTMPKKLTRAHDAVSERRVRACPASPHSQLRRGLGQPRPALRARSEDRTPASRPAGLRRIGQQTASSMDFLSKSYL